MDRVDGAVGEEEGGDRAATDRIGDLLDRGQAVIETFQLPPASPSKRLSEIRARVRKGRLHLAVLGQFKRGKSTFLNALLGGPYLPSGIIPVTAIPTFIEWGDGPHVRVSYRHDEQSEEFHPATADQTRDLLHRFVSEEGNPANRRDIARVSLFLPAPILELGIVLIDTPGVGSTHRHNTDAAFDVLPECDAGLFILSLDPPVTEGEIAYLEVIRTRVARLFFVLNKIDLADQPEQEQAIEFARAALVEKALIDGDAAIFSVSARAGLAARQAKNPEAFAASGMASVEDELLRYLAREKVQSLRAAAAMKGAAILADGESELRLRLRALELPIEALSKKQQDFEDLIRPIEGRRLTTRDLLKGDQTRIVARLETAAEQLRGGAIAHLMRLVHDAGERTDLGRFQRYVGEAIAAEIPTFFDRARDEMARQFTAECRQSIAAHRDRLRELVAAVRQTAASLFDVDLPAGADDEDFRIVQEPYWLNQKWAATFIPSFAPLVDRLLPPRVRVRRLERRIKGQLSEIVVRNVENLRWSILRSLDAAFAHAARSLEAGLDEAIAATRAGIEQARMVREGQAHQVEAEMERVRQGIAALADIRTALEVQRGAPR